MRERCRLTAFDRWLASKPSQLPDHLPPFAEAVANVFIHGLVPGSLIRETGLKAFPMHLGSRINDSGY